jgi:hypothetical protein
LEGLRVRGGLRAIAPDYGGGATAPVHFPGPIPDREPVRNG